MAGTVCVKLGAVVALVPVGAAGRVLGAGAGATEELAVFAGFEAEGAVVGAAAGVEVTGLAPLPEEVASFACPSFAS